MTNTSPPKLDDLCQVNCETTPVPATATPPRHIHATSTGAAAVPQWPWEDARSSFHIVTGSLAPWSVRSYDSYYYVSYKGPRPGVLPEQQASGGDLDSQPPLAVALSQNDDSATPKAPPRSASVHMAVELRHDDLFNNQSPPSPSPAKQDEGQRTPMVIPRGKRRVSETSQLSQVSSSGSPGSNSAADSSEGSEISSASSSEASYQPGSGKMCAVQSLVCIDKFRGRKFKPVTVGVMTMYNNIEMKATVFRDCGSSDIMLKVDPKIPRRHLRNVKLMTTPYELSVAVREVRENETDMSAEGLLHENITKHFTLKDRLLYKLVPKEKWLDTDCSIIHITVNIVYKKLHISDPADNGFVTITSTAGP